MKLLILSLLFVAAALPAAPDQLIAKEKAYLDTWRTNDAATADNILHTDYHYVGADGERHGREWTIDMIGSGRLVYESVQINRGPLHDRGDIVIVLGTLDAPGTWDGKPMEDHLAYTMVWVREKGQWKLLSEHNSRI